MHNRVILYLLLCLWGITSPGAASHLLPTTALEEHQIHKPLNITGWIQEQEENRGLQEGRAEILRLCHGSDRAKLNNKLKEYHLVNPEHEAIKLSSEYTPYSFWGKGINKKDFGILGGVLKDGKYLSAKYRINPNRSAGYGEEERYNPSSGSLSKAVYVNLYKEENRYEFVRKDNDSIVYSGRAKVCDLIAENEDGYFVTGEKEKPFVDYARENSIKTDTLLEQTSVLEELVEQVNEQLNKKVGEPKDESILGIVLSDKLQAYEEFNNRRFLVVPLKTRVLSINQRSWQELAQKVFSESELDSTDGDILITIPYVDCKGIVGDYGGHYYFMPGVATGEKVKVDFSQLQKKSYSNTTKISSFSASNEKLKLTDIGRFIMDIFTHTSKKMAIHYGLFNASGTIEYGRVYKEVTTGNNFNKQINLYVQERYTELLEIQNDYDSIAESMRKAAYSDERAAYRTDRRAAPSRNKRARRLPSSLETLEENRRKALGAKVLELSNSSEIVAYNNIPESDKILFKEAFMETVYEGNKENNARYYIQRIAFRTLQKNLRYYSTSGDKYNTAHTFNKSFWTEYVDRYVYNILDITSYVLMFVGLDVLSDGGALFYSVLRGNVDRSVEYTVSIAAPSVLGPAFRTMKATGNLFAAVSEKGVKTVKPITKKAAAKRLTKKRAKGTGNLSDRLADFPALALALAKKLDKLKGFRKNKFLDDFAKAPDDVIKKIGEKPGLVEAWEKMFNLNADDALRKNIGALEALNQPKFSRDLPETYLDADYIANHLDNFNGGVTKFVSETPSGAVGPSSGTFVMPKSQADDLIAQAGGNVNKLEDLLGLDRGTLGANPVRLDIENPSGLRMPSGNELGANEKWIPGGKTSGGTLEATVDQIQPGTYVPTPAF